MQEVRKEEHWVSARESAKVSVATAAVPQVLMTLVTPGLNGLRKEELASQMNRLLSVANVTPATNRVSTGQLSRVTSM